MAAVRLAGAGGAAAGSVYLAALGPQMLRLAGEVADGTLLNWATPERIAVSRRGSMRAPRGPRDRGGPAAPAPVFARLSARLDEAIVRIITARPGLEPVTAAMAALAPTLIRAAARSAPDHP